MGNLFVPEDNRNLATEVTDGERVENHEFPGRVKGWN